MKRANFVILALLACLPLRSQVQQFFTSDSLANITSPLDVDSLYVWLDAGVGITDSTGGAIANNEGVANWADQSGNGRTFSMSQDTRRPVYKTNILTGYPGVRFDRSNDYLYQVATDFWGSDDFTIIAVLRFNNATQNNVETIVSRYEGTSRQINFEAQNTANSYRLEVIAYKDGGTANIKTYHTSAKHTNYKIHVFTHNGASTQVWDIDGSAQSVTTITGGTGDGTVFNVTGSRFLIGCINGFSAPSVYWGGVLVELMIFTDDISAVDIAGLENYLNKKYDLY